MLLRRSLYILFIIILHPTLSFSASYTLNGSAKSLLTGGETFSGEECWSDLNRLRLDLDIKPAESVLIKAVYDNEVIIGSILNKEEFDAAKDEEDALFELTGNVIDTQDIFWRHRLYRLYLSYSRKELNLTIGRQRIAWGQGRIWNPTDLFNPVSPLRIEAEQRPGADAINMEYSSGPLSSLNIVYAPREDSRENSGGVRLRTNMKGYDISMMAGEFREDKVIGFDFAGNIGDSGFRGEGTFTSPKDGKDFTRFVLSWDYTFPNSFYLLLESLYNGGALEKGASLANITDFSGEITTINKNFLAAGAGYDITPLLRLDLYSIYDMDGGGYFANPSLKYNLFTDVDWIAGLQTFSRGEFAGVPDLYYTSVEWYF